MEPIRKQPDKFFNNTIYALSADKRRQLFPYNFENVTADNNSSFFRRYFYAMFFLVDNRITDIYSL